MWTGTAGVNGATISGTEATYEPPEGPFILACTATVGELGCSDLEFLVGTVYSKYWQES